MILITQRIVMAFCGDQAYTQGGVICMSVYCCSVIGRGSSGLRVFHLACLQPDQSASFSSIIESRANTSLCPVLVDSRDATGLLQQYHRSGMVVLRAPWSLARKIRSHEKLTGKPESLDQPRFHGSGRVLVLHLC